MYSSGMTWGKIVLLFQAVVTLLLGIVFFLQLTQLENSGIGDLDEIISEAENSENQNQQVENKVINIAQRFETAGYVLLIVSLIEIIIISRFID
jgi:hypothetical protein